MHQLLHCARRCVHYHAVVYRRPYCLLSLILLYSCVFILLFNSLPIPPATVGCSLCPSPLSVFLCVRPVGVSVTDSAPLKPFPLLSQG